MIEYNYPECTTSVLSALKIFSAKFPSYRRKEIECVCLLHVLYLVCPTSSFLSKSHRFSDLVCMSVRRSLELCRTSMARNDPMDRGSVPGESASRVRRATWFSLLLLRNPPSSPSFLCDSKVRLLPWLLDPLGNPTDFLLCFDDPFSALSFLSFHTGFLLFVQTRRISPSSLSLSTGKPMIIRTRFAGHASSCSPSRWLMADGVRRTWYVGKKKLPPFDTKRFSGDKDFSEFTRFKIRPESTANNLCSLRSGSPFFSSHSLSVLRDGCLLSAFVLPSRPNGLGRPQSHQRAIPRSKPDRTRLEAHRRPTRRGWELGSGRYRRHL